MTGSSAPITAGATTWRAPALIRRLVGYDVPVPDVVFRAAIGYRAGDWFVGEGTIRFSPVHLVLNNYWIDPKTGAKSAVQAHGAVVFNPVGPEETKVMM